MDYELLNEILDNDEKEAMGYNEYPDEMPSAALDEENDSNWTLDHL